MFPNMGFLGGVEGEDVKIVCSIPKKALLCVNTRLLVYCVSKWVHRPKLWVSRKILRTKKEFLKKWSGNFGYNEEK